MTHAPLVLIGNAKEGTVSVLRLAEGRLELIASTLVGVGCATFAVDRERDLVYCATKVPEPGVVTLRLDRESGELAEVSRRAVGEHVAYLDLTRAGTVLLGASYHGGWGRAWPVADGVLGEPTPKIEHRNLHCVVADDAGQFAYFVSLGDDLVAQCAVAEDGSLTPLDPPTVELPAGAGARHLVLAGDETSAYLVTEFTGQAFRLDRDPVTGVLAVAEAVGIVDPAAGLSVSRYGADPQAEHLIWGADVHLADGRWLLCSERSASTIATVVVGGDGRLGEVVALTSTETQPRGFGVAPDGRHVVVVGEASGAASLSRIEDDGRLTTLDRVETGAGPNWVRFV
ncbi:MAG TPA: beta-propeller fold lactonase family protein [Arachnia sp.]|nr:beta-propeller fold lactonase family protein [Arachnia sp.]HMT85237.1 beta-propeller fold lactonase family protein [Arachnia sp.]